MLAGRLQGAKRAAAERGELRFPLPVGYVYDEDGPDDHRPRRGGAARRSPICSPRSSRPARPTASSAPSRVGGSRSAPTAAPGPASCAGGGSRTRARSAVLANPAYAGTYVFGRYRSRRTVAPDGTISTKTVELPRAEWKVVIHDHHPGYITWEPFLRKRAAPSGEQQPPRARAQLREGGALCQGIVRCGGCGRPMSTSHRAGQSPVYDCSRSRADHVRHSLLPRRHRVGRR